MTVAAALVFAGTTVTTKAASLIQTSNVSNVKGQNENLVLQHANDLFNGGSTIVNQGHSSHSSHSSHESHSSHSSHSSHYSSR